MTSKVIGFYIVIQIKPEINNLFKDILDIVDLLEIELLDFILETRLRK